MQALRNAVQTGLGQFGYRIARSSGPTEISYPENSSEMQALIDMAAPYTMTSPNRQWNLLRAAQYVRQNNIVGDIVECGVWRGGNMLMLKAYLGAERSYWLYDTFAGMTQPTDADVHFKGRLASTKYEAQKREGYVDWAYASKQDVRQAFERHGLLDETVRFVEGKVEETLLQTVPQQIAILRLDTDWYESTKVELNTLYPLLSKGGVLVIDDFGDWLGAKKAVDEYFGDAPPLLIPIDHGCRIAIKL